VPVIQFSTADVLRNKVLPEGWYSWLISAIEGPTPNSKKDGVNYTAVFTLIEQGEEDGKEIRRVFSSKAMSMMIPLAAAVKGMTIDQIPKEGFALDTDELVGKKVDGKVKTDVYEGQMKNVVEEYMPYKAGKAMKADF
jgi:hypothetical protein